MQRVKDAQLPVGKASACKSKNVPLQSLGKLLTLALEKCFPKSPQVPHVWLKLSKIVKNPFKKKTLKVINTRVYKYVNVTVFA